MAGHGLAQKAWAVLGSFTEGRLAVPQRWGAHGTWWVTACLPDCVSPHEGRPGIGGPTGIHTYS